MPAPRDPDLLVRVAELYYEGRRSQEQIAEELGTSRSNVSRMLRAAQDQGIVEVRIHDPGGRDPALEKALLDRFPLTHAVVAHTAATRTARPLERLGVLAWQWVRHELRDGMTVALSWGRTLQAMVWAMDNEVPLGIDVVQLVGGLSSLDSEISGQELIREMATRLGARYRYLHAPAVFSTAAACQALLAEASVADALDAARHADLAVVGIGAVHHGSSAALVRSLGLTKQEQAGFEAARPVGDLAARFYDVEGREIAGPVHDRVLAVTLDDIRAIPTVVAVAAGRDKVPGILGALNGRLVDVLVTDATAARGLLARPERP